MDNNDNSLILYKFLYALIIFLGAFLIFIFEPVTGKIVTPQYGGGADIWTTCLVFFQLMLFFGYLLALFLNKLKPKTNAVCYLTLFILAFCLFRLPTEFGSWLSGDLYISHPLVSLFLSLFKYAMLPILVLSTISVSMQNWYTKQTGKTPYVLYSVSNIGSFLALFIYPFVYEPIMPTSSVIKLWRICFAALVLLVATASVIYYKKEGNKQETQDIVEEKISVKKYIYWAMLSAAGTIMLASYTSYTTIMVLPLPMLWTVFLGTYLLTFILCFGSEKFYKKGLLITLVPVLSTVYLFFGITSLTVTKSYPLVITLLLTIFFVFLMILNGEIYKTRPNPSKLSEFYLTIAFGGALGGLFVNIVAPVIFNTYAELILINFLMCVFVFYILMKDILVKKPVSKFSWLKAGSFVLIMLILAYFYFPWRKQLNKDIIKIDKRNFYGTTAVITNKKLQVKKIVNGDTIHGAQYYDFENDIFNDTPLTYYGETSAFSFAVEGMRNFNRGKNVPLNFGAIGLGTGTVAAYTKEDDRMIFYEIDPKIYDIARNEFEYLKMAKGNVDVILGDARIELDKRAPQGYDILLVDAFSSDSVPSHLITKEAFDVYKKHTKDDGIILFHISNRYLALERLLKKLADTNGLKNVYFFTNYFVTKNARSANFHLISNNYFLIFMPENKLYENFKDYKSKFSEKGIITISGSLKVKEDEFLKVFTDDYSSLIRLFSFWK